MTLKHRMPPACPVCSGTLFPSEVSCEECGARVRAAFKECAFCRLTPDQLQFVEIFLRSRGNLSGVGDELDISYPTVARRLDAVLAALDGHAAPMGTAQPAPPPAEAPPPAPEPDIEEEARARERREILDMLDRGEITAEQATRRLQDL